MREFSEARIDYTEKKIESDKEKVAVDDRTLEEKSNENVKMFNDIFGERKSSTEESTNNEFRNSLKVTEPSVEKETSETIQKK
jgi:hypothetical protein